MKAGFISLGCVKNLVDTEVMLGLIAEMKIDITPDPAQADILIINTCGFIDSAKEESISTILQMNAYKQNGSCRALIVAGCLGQRYQKDLLDEMPEVDAIIGTGAWHRINEAIEAVLKGQRVLLIGPTDNIYDETMPRITTTPVYSSYVKIAEGCSNCCAYCVIPQVRGPFRSRSIESIVNEVKMLAKNGTKEINLIAQDTTSYGKDLYGEPQLTALLRNLVKIEDIDWIRLLYCYPRHFSDELIQLIAAEPKICNYVDLPLQHAHDDILSAMNRADRKYDIEQLLNKIRTQIPGVAIRTSFIVGFPGETEEHFSTLLEFVQNQRFDSAGVFIYSREEGTVAGDNPNQIDDEIKQERYHELMALQAKISEENNINKENILVDILLEGFNENEQGQIIAYGRTYREAPDIDGRIFIENAADSTVGTFIKAKITQGFTYDIVAEKI